MYADKLGYARVNNATAIIKTGPAGFFGLSVTGAGAVSVYDGLSASGVLLYTHATAPVALTVDFGGNGISCAAGLTVVTTGVVNIIYT